MTTIAREFRAKSQPRRGLRRVEAAAYVGISPTKFDDMVQDGRMPHPKRIDGAAVWDIHSLDDAFDELPDNAQGRKIVGKTEGPNPWD